MKTGYTIRVLAVCVLLMCLLAGCQTEGQNSIPAQSNVSSSELNGETGSAPIQSTPGSAEETADDPDIQYFTPEEFDSVIVGESTLEDVWEIIENPYWVAMTSYGGFSEYPMRDGNCIRIEYTMDYVVCKKEVTAPTVDPQTFDTNTDADSGSHNPVGFADYDRFIAFFREQADDHPVSEIYTSKDIKTYIQNIRDGMLPLMIPYLGNDRLPLSKEGDTFTMPVYIGYSIFSGSCFQTVIDGNDVQLYIYALSEEDAAMAKKMTCPEVINILDPTIPNIPELNVGLFDYREYDAVFEDTAVIAGESKTMLVQQRKDGMECIYYVTDGCLIKFYAPIGTVTKDWLKDFSLVAH